MPELPEVETVRLGLTKLNGWQIQDTELLLPRIFKSEIPLSQINNFKISNIQRRGKFLWFEFDQPFHLICHLGMSGRFLLNPDNPRHPRVKLILAKGQKIKTLIYDDQRTFGWLKLEPRNNSIPKSVSHIALDPFDSKFNSKAVINTMQSRKATIKYLLLNQSIMSGVGNIYADESLWMAKIHPNTPGDKLSTDQLRLLIQSVKKVMQKALAKGGTSFDALYVNINGDSGFFEISLKAYGQDGKPCSRCGSLIKAIKFGARHSHFCPKCQKK